VQDFLHHVAGACNHEHARGDAEDDDKLGYVQKDERLTAREHEAAEGGPQHNRCA
jgi:hypothetical protein